MILFPALFVLSHIHNINITNMMMFIIFIISFPCCCSATTAITIDDPYSEALLMFKKNMIIMNHASSLSNWILPNATHEDDDGMIIYACSWSGIVCDHNRTAVLSIDLSSSNLGGHFILPQNFHLLFAPRLLHLNISHNSFSGPLPASIFNLTALTILDISRNNFSGPFPAAISNLANLVVFNAFSNSFSGSLPADVSIIQPLRVLNLAGSYFTGPIPPQYGDFSSLEFLHLAGNLLAGNIPEELGQLGTLQHMEIGYNSYQPGTIPWQLGNMTNLRYLDIASANLSGSIPAQLGNLTNLRSLFLFRNHLTGNIPSEFSRISTLTDLDLSDNKIQGPIPDGFSQLKNLKLLSLMYNAMTGTIPRGIADLPFLDTMFLWNNFFTGPLPDNLGKNSKLKWVDVSTNSFNGSIPSGICSGGVLSKLLLFSNNFTGTLSASLSNCSSLVRVRIENNSFSGEIPFKFSQLPYLEYIDMSNNKFSGGIPVDISQASKLKFVNVSFNDISGSIPSNNVLKSMGESAFDGNANLCGAPLTHLCISPDGSKLRAPVVLLICAGLISFISVLVLGIYYLRKRRLKGQWEMVSYSGLPRFTANDVLNRIRISPPDRPSFVSKAILPTGIIVSVKRIEWQANKFMKEHVTKMGNARHKNLVRLLGVCYIHHEAYLLYDYMQPNENLAERIRTEMDWPSKRKIVNGIARGLSHLHHERCISHGDLKLSNIMCDANMEPLLGEFGLKWLFDPARKTGGGFRTGIKQQINMDVYKFGEVTLEILTNGKLANAGKDVVQDKSNEAIFREVYKENGSVQSVAEKEEIKVVTEAALFCIRSMPSMEDVLKHLSGSKQP